MELNDITKALCEITGYQQYSQHGCDGLWRWDGKKCDVLAIAAGKPGTGQCRRFIDKLMAKCDRVRFVHVDSDILRAALQRRGFKAVEWFEGGELVTGMRWTR